MTRRDKQSRLQSEIESNLKRAYEEVLHQDVPDRFTQLLAQLRDSEADHADEGGEKAKEGSGINDA